MFSLPIDTVSACAMRSAQLAAFRWTSSMPLGTVLLAHFDGHKFLDDAPLSWVGEYIITCSPNLAKQAYPMLASKIVGDWDSRTMLLVEADSVCTWIHFMEETHQ